MQSITYLPSASLSDKLDDATGGLDLLLGEGRDEAGLDNEGLVNAALAKELELAAVGEVDHGDSSGRSLDLSLGKRDELEIVRSHFNFFRPRLPSASFCCSPCRG